MSEPDFINLYTGLTQNVIILMPHFTLADIRKQITQQDIIKEEGEDDRKWRFLIRVMEIDTKKVVTIPYTDAVLGKELEQYTNAKQFIDGRNTLYMVNTEKPTPDLFGLKAPKFTQDKVECYVFRNTTLSPYKTNPILLEHVRALKDVGTSYNNVLVCRADTAIILYVKARGHSAFGYSIVSDAGDVIVDELISFTNDNTVDAACSIKRYQKQDKAIVVDAIPTSIPSNERYKRSRITITLWNVYSVTDKNGRKIDFSKPRSYSSDALKAYAGAPSREGVVLPSDGIESALIREGEATNVDFGTIRHVDDNKDDILGVIQMDLFVFKTTADAEKIFEMNLLQV